MSGESAGMGGTETEEISDNVRRLIGVASSVGNFAALTAVSYFLFESDWLVFGLVMGLLSGAGSFFLIPWILQQQQEQNGPGTGGFDDETVAATHREEDSNGARLAAFGAGMEAAAIGMLAGRIALEEVLLGGAVGIAVGLAVFLLASIAFEHAT